ncbi:MAG: hypothetical protein JXB85_06590 [Anaerolineales bacterium]|nr:hypothetical protein [Anaerolineales bacterium]
MRPIRFWSTGLLLALVLAACAPALADMPPATDPPVAPTPTEPLVEALPTVTGGPGASSEPLAVPTTRGDALQASNPATISLAIGKPQLIEFFAFW